MYRAVCPNCGKSVTLDEPEAVFCPYCRTEIPLMQEPQGSEEEFASLADELIDEGEYEAFLDSVAVKEGKQSPLFAAFSRIMLLNRDYIREADQLYEKDSAMTALNAIKKLATGSDAYTDNPIHTRYMEKVDQLANGFADLLEKDSSTEGKKLAGMLTRKLLLPTEDNAKRHLSVVLMADDYSCHRLIPHLTDEDLTEIYEAYTQTPDFYLVSPKQVLLSKEMKAAILSRGLKLPGKESSLFDRIKKIFK